MEGLALAPCIQAPKALTLVSHLLAGQLPCWEGRSIYFQSAPGGPTPCMILYDGDDDDGVQFAPFL